MATIAGKTGYIGLPTNTNFALSSWDWTLESDAPDTTSFNSSGQEENMAGLQRGKLSARGPYNNGSMALTVGSSYAATFGMNSTVSFTGNVRITSIKLTTDIKDVVQVAIEGKSNGAFTAAIT